MKKMASIVLPSLKEPSVCGACGGEFVCGASLAGCWCARVELSDEVRAELRARYKDCLCPACLERYAAGVVDKNEEGARG